MGRLSRFAGLAGTALLAGMQLIRPARTNPPTDPGRTLAARMTVTPAVASVLDRSCRDCHSHDTTWPWYSNVAPVSWFVIDHVNSGRRHFNYSNWAAYKPDKARKILQDICEDVRDKDMPIGTYLIVHRDAQLSEGNVQTLCDWSSSLRVAVAHD